MNSKILGPYGNIVGHTYTYTYNLILKEEIAKKTINQKTAKEILLKRMQD